MTMALGKRKRSRQRRYDRPTGRGPRQGERKTEHRSSSTHHTPKGAQHGPPAACAGKFTVSLLPALSTPLHIDFFHLQRAKMFVGFFPACQRWLPGEIGPIRDDMRK